MAKGIYAGAARESELVADPENAPTGPARRAEPMSGRSAEE